MMYELAACVCTQNQVLAFFFISTPAFQFFIWRNMKQGTEAKTHQNIIILLFFFSIFLGTLKASNSGAGWEGRTVDPSHLSASSLSCHSSCAGRGVALQIILSQTDRISCALVAEGN